MIILINVMKNYSGKLAENEAKTLNKDLTCSKMSLTETFNNVAREIMLTATNVSNISSDNVKRVETRKFDEFILRFENH